MKRTFLALAFSAWLAASAGAVEYAEWAWSRELPAEVTARSATMRVSPRRVRMAVRAAGGGSHCNSLRLFTCGSSAGVANQTYEIAALYGLCRGPWGGFY